MSFNQNQKQRLAEIYREMNELLDEAVTIVTQNGDKREIQIAKEMWAGYISTGLDGSAGYSFVVHDKNNLLSFLNDLGYNEDEESFEDDEEEESEENDDDDDGLGRDYDDFHDKDKD